MSSAIHVVDSHTEGEPTRIIVGGGPELPGATMAARRDAMCERFDHIRTGVVREPRGHDAVVGGILTPPVCADSLCGVIFFNDAGYLGMCGHGLMGVARTLMYLGRVIGDRMRVDTPVGTVGAQVAHDGDITICNVESHCETFDVTVEVPGLGAVTGDIAYGGNWFFITQWDLSLDRRELAEIAQRIRTAVREIDPRIDHIELMDSATRSDADARNFVLCPGVAYDRSPCGTGTSAKLATLHARGKLQVGEQWRQESTTGSLFTGWLQDVDGVLHPHIRGRAFITAEARLYFDELDPFRWGIPG